MRQREPRKPPAWFKWAIWAGIAIATALPTMCMLNYGALPTYKAPEPAPT